MKGKLTGGESLKDISRWGLGWQLNLYKSLKLSLEKLTLCHQALKRDHNHHDGKRAGKIFNWNLIFIYC